VEIYGETVAKAQGLSFTALRIATVVGSGARKTASPWRSEIFDKPNADDSQPIVIPFSGDVVLSLVHVEDVARMLLLLATQDNSSTRIYNTPAENCRAGDLKRMVEAREDCPRVELGTANQRAAPSVADGARFIGDFAYTTTSLEQRLRTVSYSTR
jgi:nucleoside-diphosphate-sugar epimerase